MGAQVENSNLFALLNFANGVDSELLEALIPGILGVLEAGVVNARRVNKDGARGGVRSKRQGVGADKANSRVSPRSKALWRAKKALR